MNLEAKVDLSKEKVLKWFRTMAIKNKGFGVYKCSSFHDVEKYPSVLLPGTYDATNCLVLLGAYKDVSDSHKSELAEFINNFQTENGAFRISQMNEDEIYKIDDKKYTWEYIDFHITNYCMGALNNIGHKPRHEFKFMQPYMTETALEGWINKRIMHDPWMEGNNFVNISSFFIELKNSGNEMAKKQIERILDWHDENVDSNTGYWGTNLKDNPASILYGMAGAAHDYHIYTYFNRRIKHVDKIVDYCLKFISKGISRACLDVDVVDILVNMLPYDYRKQEILDKLEVMLVDLLNFQNEDGGFCDVKEGIRRQDGWVKGYWEPQGLSNSFATWFRCVTIGMIVCNLYPNRKSEWNFRNSIGIGYYNKDYNPMQRGNLEELI